MTLLPLVEQVPEIIPIEEDADESVTGSVSLARSTTATLGRTAFLASSFDRRRLSDVTRLASGPLFSNNAPFLSTIQPSVIQPFAVSEIRPSTPQIMGRPSVLADISIRDLSQIARATDFVVRPQALENLGAIALPNQTAIQSLAKLPSRPPANPEQLKISKADAFRPGGDITSQILINLDASLKPSLYNAWGNSLVTDDLDLLETVKSVEKFEVKAAPFGHNAPNPAIYPPGNDGRVEFDEWDLPGEILPQETITLEVGLRRDGSSLLADFTYEDREKADIEISSDNALTATVTHAALGGTNTKVEEVRTSIFSSSAVWLAFSHGMTDIQTIDIYVAGANGETPSLLVESLQRDEGSGYVAVPARTATNGSILFVVPAGEDPDEATIRQVFSDLRPRIEQNSAYIIQINGTFNNLDYVVESEDIDRLKLPNEHIRIAFRFLRSQREFRFVWLHDGPEDVTTGEVLTNPDTPLVVQIDDGNLTSLMEGFEQRYEANAEIDGEFEGRRIVVRGSLADQSGESADLMIQETAFAPDSGNVIDLDAEYDKIIPGSWVAIVRSRFQYPLVAQVQSVRTISKADFGITGRVTQLTLDRQWLSISDRILSDIRDVTVYAQSQPLALTDEVLEPTASAIGGEDPNSGGPFEIELAELYGGLKPGRWLIVSGERTDIADGQVTGVRASELVMLAGVRQGVSQVWLPAPEDSGSQGLWVDLPGDRPHSFLQLAQPLAYRYKRDTVIIYGNVVKATHGETRREVLGSGDGSKTLQQFGLNKSPLTYLSAPTRQGTESTLEVHVNDVEWQEVASLAQAGARDRSFVTRTDNDGKTHIIFGDGEHGARLPSGVENVSTVYRDGIGKAGNIKAEQIKLLATRPLGVKGVINPLAATGGANRETLLQAKRNAPMAVMALDRLVSVQDYADFVRTYAGIAKADAQTLSNGRRQLIHLTIAGADNIPITQNSDLYRNLSRALKRFGDPYQPVQIDIRELMLLIISARIRILPDYLWESVKGAIETALLEEFSFERRNLGEDVLLSEVISTIHRVPGVAYVDVDVLDSVSETEAGDPMKLTQKLLQLSQNGLLTPAGASAGAAAEPPESDSSAASNEEEDLEDEMAAEAPAEKTPADESLPGVTQPRQRIPVNLARINRTEIWQAQLAMLSPELPEALKLEEITR
ncbi:MAG: putative baseplate assembly protein [Cyanobacteria bacterium P01_F01_bin.86]